MKRVGRVEKNKVRRRQGAARKLRLSVFGTLALMVALLGNGGPGAPSCNCNPTPPPPGPPRIYWYPKDLSFKGVAVGGCSEALSLEIRNAGSARGSKPLPLSLDVSISAGSDDFEIVSGNGVFTLEYGSSRTVSMQFCPDAVGQKMGKLRIEHNGVKVDSPVDVPLTGTGL